MKFRTPALPDLDSAITYDLWGCRWTAIASAKGVTAAAAQPLPAQAEEKAQAQAKTFHDLGLDPAMLAQVNAESWAAKALKAYHAAQPHLEAARAQLPTPNLLRHSKKTRRAARRLDAAERLGRAAAKACRIVFLAVNARAATPQPSNRKPHP